MDEKTDDISLSHHDKEILKDQQSTSTVINEDLEKSSSTFQGPPDGGWEAWLVVFGGFLGNVSIFGVNYTWAVFLSHYNTNVYPGKMNELSWIGSICVALFFVIGPINEWISCKIGYRYMLLIGAILCPLGLMLASITQEIWQLYLTQGVIFGLGASFVFFPSLAAPQQWFSSRRGLAVAGSMCGSGIGSLIFSNVAQAAIANLDYRWALRIEGFMCFALLLLAAAVVRPPKNAEPTQRESYSQLYQKQKQLMKSRSFQIMFLMGIVTTFGYLTPAFFLASYAEYLGLNPWVGSNLGAITSAVNTISMLVIGWISDRTGRFNGLFICTFLAGVFTLTLWTTATSEVSIWIYVVLYGFFGGGYLSLNGAALPEVAGYDNISAANGLFYITSTLGYMFGTPISSAIINSRSDPPGYIYAAVWSGVLMAVGGILCWMLRVTRSGWNPLIKA
ncbi:major facilitator superfamily domain-containing protein [Choanephora cucurbitarum]|nr:major facilitator superfamily domain-containing protein [Choanephora cucurbitarum]